MLTNRVYLGEVRHRDEWYPGLHSAIIDPELFDDVQVIMAERDRSNEKYKPGKRYASPLGGLIWCKHCGAKYHWRNNGLNKKDGKARGYYVCYSRSKCDPKMVRDPNCTNKTYRDMNLEPYVYNEIKKLKSEPTYIDQLRKSVDTSAKQATIQTRVDKLASQISRFMDLYSLGEIPLDEISAKIKPLSDEKRGLESELKTLQAIVPVAQPDHIRGLAEMFEDVLATGDCYAIRDAVAELIDYIEIDDEKIFIHWNF